MIWIAILLLLFVFFVGWQFGFTSGEFNCSCCATRRKEYAKQVKRERAKQLIREVLAEQE